MVMLMLKKSFNSLDHTSIKNSNRTISIEKLEASYLKMVISMKDNGISKPIYVTVKVSKFQKMVLFTRVSGQLTRHTAWVDLFTATVMFMTASGMKINNTATVPTNIQMALTTKEIGLMTSRTAKERKHGPINRPMKAHMRWARRKAKVSSPGKTKVPILVSSKVITCTDRESIFGLMNVSMMETGLITRWMVMVYSLGPMVACMMEITKKTRRRV